MKAHSLHTLALATALATQALLSPGTTFTAVPYTPGVLPAQQPFDCFEKCKKTAEPNYDKILEHMETDAFKQQFASVIQKAISTLDTMPKPQLENGAVVIDLDETLLDNREYYRRHKHFSQELWDRWVAEGNATAIEPTRQLIEWLKDHHVPVYFVTGRWESQREVTLANLKKLGITHYAGLYMRPDACRDKTSVYKSQVRQEIEAETGRKILINVGDQQSDLDGPASGIGFKVPNPLYTIPDKPKQKTASSTLPLPDGQTFSRFQAVA